jgi:hypothetical protein
MSGRHSSRFLGKRLHSNDRSRVRELVVARLFPLQAWFGACRE